ncbi:MULTISPECIES: LysR family transcriptional regulator [Streptomyces]|uniref:LysR family transcriptional regulator n=1 Tax=Streptomyces TaxID=1883 RepID=UPI000A3C893D|nr:LysR substrate-binding domain-containing protein [Streptomyces glaucescens]
MELRHLQYFVAVAEELHFGRAAARLGIAQPGLSQQIKALERRLCAELFERDRRGVELTEAGRVLLPLARDVLSRSRNLQEVIRTYGTGEVGRLRIGIARSAAGGVSDVLVEGFMAEYPQVEVRLSSGYTAAHEVELSEGTIDVAFVRLPLENTEELVGREVADEPLVVALPARHRLAARSAVGVADLAGEPFVWWPRENGPGMWDRILDQVFGPGNRPEIARWEPEEERMLHAVAHGHGITVLGEGRAGRLSVPGVVIKPFAEPVPTCALGLAWRGDNTLPTLHRFLRHADAVIDASA